MQAAGALAERPCHDTDKGIWSQSEGRIVNREMRLRLSVYISQVIVSLHFIDACLCDVDRYKTTCLPDISPLMHKQPEYRIL
jgi:hypothetical protein